MADSSLLLVDAMLRCGATTTKEDVIDGTSARRIADKQHERIKVCCIVYCFC